MAASWPTSVATDSELYIAVNELQNNLASSINNSVTSLTLNSATGFPTVGLVLIDNEVILYTGISTNTLTGLTRGYDGTAAASHSSGAVVSFAIMAAHHNVLKDEIKAIETYLSNNLGTGSQPLSNGNRALQSNGSGKITEATTTATELGYLSGVTSAIQTQLNARVTSVSGTANQITSSGGTTPTLAIANPLTLPGPMTAGGAIAMASNKITGLAAGTANGDAMRYEEVFPFRVLQIVTASTTTSASLTNNGTFTATNLAASITPASTTSKILVISCNNEQNTGGTGAVLTHKRGSTQLTTVLEFNPTDSDRDPITMVDLDSPATTSSTTYTVYQKTNGAGTIIHTNVQVSTIFLIEIG